MPASDNGEWTDLPAEGREGEAPDWPLGGDETRRELELWAELWRLPQAVAWERHRQHLEVAMYVRAFVEAEKPGAPAAGRTLALRMMEGLGLSQPGLARNRWRITADAVGAAREKTPGPVGA